MSTPLETAEIMVAAQVAVADGRLSTTTSTRNPLKQAMLLPTASDPMLEMFAAQAQRDIEKITAEMRTGHQLKEETGRLKVDVVHAGAVAKVLDNKSSEVASRVDNDLKAPTKAAIDALVDFAFAVEALSKTASADGLRCSKSLLADCKAKGLVAHQRFDGVHDQASALLKESGDVLLEATREESMASDRGRRVAEIMTIAQQEQQGQEEARRMTKDRLEVARKEHDEAVKGRVKAEHKLAEARQLSKTRVPGFLGVGALAANFILDEVKPFQGAVDAAETAVEARSKQLGSAKDSFEAAKTKAEAAKAELDAIVGIQNDLGPLAADLKTQLESLDVLRKKLTSMQNRSNGAALFTGALSATSSTLPLDYSPAVFAQDILKLQATANVDSSFKQTLLAKQPEALTATLEAIAKSNVNAVDLF